MKKRQFTDLDGIQFRQMQDFYWQYLEHRLSDPTPHATFQRFLVARNQRPSATSTTHGGRGTPCFLSGWKLNSPLPSPAGG